MERKLLIHQLIILIALCLASCTGGGESSGTSSGGGSSGGSTTSSAPPQPTTESISVIPALGKFKAGASVRIVQTNGTVVAQGTVAADGTAKMEAMTGKKGPFLIEVGVNGDSYFDAKRQTYVTIQLPAGTYAIRAVSPYLYPRIGVSPFTEIATVLLESQSGGFAGSTIEKVIAANMTVKKWFRLRFAYEYHTASPEFQGLLMPAQVFENKVEFASYFPFNSTYYSFGSDAYVGVNAAIFSYNAAPACGALDVVHQISDDIKDGVFDLRIGGTRISCVDPSVFARIDAWLATNSSTPYYLDASNQLRFKVDNTPVTGTNVATLKEQYQLTYARAILSVWGDVVQNIIADYIGASAYAAMGGALYWWSSGTNMNFSLNMSDLYRVYKGMMDRATASPYSTYGIPTAKLYNWMDDIAPPRSIGSLVLSGTSLNYDTVTNTVIASADTLATLMDKQMYGTDTSCPYGFHRGLILCEPDSPTSSTTGGTGSTTGGTTTSSCGTPGTIITIKDRIADVPQACRDRQWSVFAYASTASDACMMTGDAFGQDKYLMAIGRAQSPCYCKEGYYIDLAVRPWTCHVFFNY